MKLKTSSILVVAGAMLISIGGCGTLGTPCGADTGITCAGPFFCFYEEGCGKDNLPGVCQPIPEICTEIYAPVCGCDGETYSNDCMAWGNSTNIASTGECQQTP